MTITVEHLEETYHVLKNSSYKGVPGVMRIDGPLPGPTVGITVCTHGNEPCGLAAVRDILAREGEDHGVLRGTLYLVLNNIDAAAVAFESIRAGDEKLAGRCVDVNMNRLPANTLELRNDARYEIRRVQELAPIWSEFEYALDIHSTTQDAGTMLIEVNEHLPLALTRGFDMEKIISNITRVQVGRPAAYFYGTAAKPVKAYAIECGAHVSPKTFACAVTCVTAFLQNLGMLAGTPVTIRETYDEYYIDHSIMFPNVSYALVEQFGNFAPLAKGTVLATGNGDDIVASMDGHTLFAGHLSFKKEEDIREEVMFITRPVRKRSLS